MGFMFRCVDWNILQWSGEGWDWGKLQTVVLPNGHLKKPLHSTGSLRRWSTSTKAVPEAMHFNVCTFAQAPEGRPIGIPT